MGYLSQYPPAHSDTYVKATETYSSSYYPYFSTDPAKSLIGTGADNKWYPNVSTVSNQRFHIDLGSAKIIKRIYYENDHTSGSATDRGVQNFTFWGSNEASAFADLVYGNDDDWTQLTTGQSTFDEHVGANQADPKYILVTNSTAYRYYAFKFVDNRGDVSFLGIRRVELQIEESIPTYEGEDTLTLSDVIELNVSLEKIELSDTLNLSDNLKFSAEQQESSDTTDLSDEISLSIAKSNEDTLTLSDDLEVLLSKDLDDTLTLSDEITVATIEEASSNIYNKFGMVNGVLLDVDNKIGFIGRNLSDINNKVGFLKSWQVAGDAGFQSLGKTYIKVYIDSVEQTDVDIDSITISKILNGSHSANFILGRPYDNNKPSQESVVEIKYHTWTLYKGYITQITPTNNPDSIKIICQDEYWKQNKTKQYFYIGHKPTDNQELYYNHISEGLSVCGVNFGIGGFIPQPINCFGTGTSECISNLVTNSGNYAWYYDVDGSKKLWTSGQGDIINLEKQEIGKNLGLYQVLRHSFKESIENIVNKFRVQMGDKVIRRFNNSGGTKEYTGHEYEYFYGGASSAWDSTYERLAQNSDDGHGVFHHPVSQNDLYEDVFTKYYLPTLNSTLESWTDRFPPLVKLMIPFGFWKCSFGDFKWYDGSKRITEGFTIDYESGTLTFNEPVYIFQTNENGEMTSIRKPTITLQLWKEKYYSNTETPSDNPATDISNPLMFFTDKMGDYPETIMENLDLGGLSIQVGSWYIAEQTDEQTTWRLVPSWNDTLFATDYANWQLSKNCDKKVNGSIDLTIDTIQFYDITLDKRIMIDGIIENPLNIIGITYNIGNWRASVQLENGRYYNRTSSIQSRGE